MKLTLSVDEQVVARARKKAESLGKSLNQLVRDYLQSVAGGDDPERSIEEFRSFLVAGIHAAGASTVTRSMSVRSFFDTNILVYTDDKAFPAKQRRVEGIRIENPFLEGR